MSTLDADLDAAAEPVEKEDDFQLTSARTAAVGDMTVRRLLPLRLRRSVGAWCFVDHYGPMSVDGVTGMRGAAAPAHRAADGHLAAGRRRAAPRQPGQRADDPARPAEPDDGGARASPTPRSRRPSTIPPLHGVQLWVALPDASGAGRAGVRASRGAARAGVGGLEVTVFLGSLAGRRVAGALTFSAHRRRAAGGGPGRAAAVPLAPRIEHVAVRGRRVGRRGGDRLRPGQLLYLATGREQVQVSAAAGGRGVPARRGPAGRAAADVVELRRPDPEEIKAAARLAGGQVRRRWAGTTGEPLAAPPLDAAGCRQALAAAPGGSRLLSQRKPDRRLASAVGDPWPCRTSSWRARRRRAPPHCTRRWPGIPPCTCHRSRNPSSS